MSSQNPSPGRLPTLFMQDGLPNPVDLCPLPARFMQTCSKTFFPCTLCPPAMAVYTSTPEEARWRAAAVEQFISCSAWSVNMMSIARASRGFGLFRSTQGTRVILLHPTPMCSTTRDVLDAPQPLLYRLWVMREKASICMGSGNNHLSSTQAASHT